MALTPFGNFTLDWTAKPTKISGQATNFKTWLNQRTEDIKAYINDTLLTQLGATTDGASGADQIGATAIAGFAGATVQALLESIAGKFASYETAADSAKLKRRMMMGVKYFG